MNLTVVGIGSRMGSDDAIGLSLAEALSPSISSGLTIRLWEDADALTLAHDLLDLKEPVLIVDCADMGMAPGSWRFFTKGPAQLKLHHSSVSSHGFGMAEALTLAERLGFSHPAYFFGVQPFDLSPGGELTPELSALFPKLLVALQEQIENLSAVRRSESAS